jgi:class 3 adenylate cyclase
MDEATGLELGAIDYIYKPISPAIVKKRVKNHLELKRLHDQEKAYLKQIEREKEKLDLLLANILPDSIADQLKECQNVIAESFAEITVMFIDLVGFTELSGQIPAVKLVLILNEIFSTFDSLAEKHKLEKIKTIGDSYMVVGGLLPEQKNHAEIIADMALDIIDVIARYEGPDGESFNIRIGINTGPVIAGVIGKKKYSFDLWGETVNIASRMESQGEAGRIQVTESTYQLISSKYHFEKREPIDVKGKGEMQTYFILGKLAKE